MKRLLLLLVAVTPVLLIVASPPVDSACCYFAAKDKDILQPAQKAFITWDPAERVESFTVQPRFEGNAEDFGMVIPTPTKPKLDEMPREFFKELAIYTILEPMDIDKYKSFRLKNGGLDKAPEKSKDKPKVKVIEFGVVGSLEYKIIVAERADDLYTWLKDHKYNYGGDEATLDHYIKKKWFYTVMKIDTMQMKKRADGTFDGEVTPTRFTFSTDKPIYPLKITQISVKDKTEALFYVQAPFKTDLAGDFSYQPSWIPMWHQAMSFAVAEKMTKDETAWQKHVEGKVKDFVQTVNNQGKKGREATTLEWAKKITAKDIGILEGTEKYNREAPAEDVKALKILKGHVKKDQFVTKFRKVFTKAEMADDLEIVRAKVADKEDNIEYFSILPTSPP